jgi:hypothetical protein
LTAEFFILDFGVQPLLKTCCKTPYVAPFDAKQTQMCSKDKSVQNFANFYKLNTLMTTQSEEKLRIRIIIIWCCPRGGVIIDIYFLKTASVPKCNAAVMFILKSGIMNVMNTTQNLLLGLCRMHV